jgi:hypothetical protein
MLRTLTILAASTKDKTSGTPVTNVTRNKKVYKLISARDRDKDGIACEKK